MVFLDLITRGFIEDPCEFFFPSYRFHIETIDFFLSLIRNLCTVLFQLTPHIDESLNGGDVSDDTEDDQQPAQERQAKDSFGYQNSQNSGNDKEKEPVCPSKESPIIPANANSLGLGSQIRDHEYPDKGKHPDRPWSKPTGENPGDNENIGVAVDNMVKKVPLLALGIHGPGHGAIHGIKRRVAHDEKGPEHHIGVEKGNTRKQCHKKGGNGKMVRFYTDPQGDTNEGPVDPGEVWPERVKGHVIIPM
jgi:hypothetical protein